MTLPAPEPGPLRLAWAVTYQVPGPHGTPGGVVTEILNADWCRSAGYQEADVRDPIRAAWTLALLLGSQDHEDAHLLAVEPAP